MKRGGQLERRTALRSRSEPIRRAPLAAHGRSQLKQSIPLAVRREVHARSGGLCECGCGRRANHLHHRRLRSQGGRHDAVNLCHLSHECHAAAHANPDRSYALGLIVPSWRDPADVPVTRVREDVPS